MKPTYGRVSRYGLVAFASSLDQIGPLARTAEDAALLLEVIAGHDPRDSTSADRRRPAVRRRRSRQPLDGLRLGVVREHFGEGLDAEVDAAVREAIDVFRSLGATVRDVALPHSKYGDRHLLHHRAVRGLEQSGPLRRRALRLPHRRGRDAAPSWTAERRQRPTAADGRRHARWCGCIASTRAEGFGPEVKRRIMLGTYALECRLLRRLLPQGAQGAAADPQGLRRGLSSRST